MGAGTTATQDLPSGTPPCASLHRLRYTVVMREQKLLIRTEWRISRSSWGLSWLVTSRISTPPLSTPLLWPICVCASPIPSLTFLSAQIDSASSEPPSGLLALRCAWAFSLPEALLWVQGASSEEATSVYHMLGRMGIWGAD